MAERNIAEDTAGRPGPSLGTPDLDAATTSGRATETVPSEGEAPISEASLTDEAVQVDIAPERLDQLHEDPGIESGVGAGHQQDVLPSDEDEESDGEDSDGPTGGPDSSGPTGELFDTVDVGQPGEQDTAEDPFDLDSGLRTGDAIGGPGEHERGVIDELSEDPLDSAFDDPTQTLEGVPDDYDLSGNEAGDGGKDVDSDDSPGLLDFIGWLTKPAGGGAGGSTPGPTNGNPFDGMKYVEGEGYVDMEDDETDPDSTTILEHRLEHNANEQDAAEAADDGTVDGPDSFALDWVASLFGGEDHTTTEPAPTEDRDPDSEPAPKSPTHDDNIGTEYFGIGAAADKGSEVQYADMPEDDDSGDSDYDGIDYGENHVEPDFDIAEAEEMIFIDPMDQPDVDPSDQDSDEAAEMVE